MIFWYNFPPNQKNVKGPGLIPHQGTKIPQAMQSGQRKKRETDALSSFSFYAPLPLPRGFREQNRARTRNASASKQVMDQQSVRESMSDLCFNLFNKSESVPTVD